MNEQNNPQRRDSDMNTMGGVGVASALGISRPVTAGPSGSSAERAQRKPGCDEDGSPVTAKAILADTITALEYRARVVSEKAARLEREAAEDRKTAADARLRAFHLSRSLAALHAADPLSE